MNVITMTTKPRTPKTRKRQAIESTPKVLEALRWAAISLGYDRTDEPCNSDEADDRKHGRTLAELAQDQNAVAPHAG
jgi:hypothetical protein